MPLNLLLAGADHSKIGEVIQDVITMHFRIPLVVIIGTLFAYQVAKVEK